MIKLENVGMKFNLGIEKNTEEKGWWEKILGLDRINPNVIPGEGDFPTNYTPPVESFTIENQHTYQEFLTKVTAPTKDGAVFVGWYDSTDDSKTIIDGNDSIPTDPIHDITLVAKYTTDGVYKVVNK